MGLTKVDVARRQLVTSIRLLFDGADLVSIYSLAANAWEVIDTLCVRAGIESISSQTRTHIPDGKDLKFDYVNSPYRNFFKHADRDADVVLDELKEANVDSIVYLAVEDYIRLCRKSPAEFQVFQLWYLALYVDKVSDDSLAKILSAVAVYFPNIRELPRHECVSLGRQVLARALKDPELISDARTESPF